MQLPFINAAPRVLRACAYIYVAHALVHYPARHGAAAARFARVACTGSIRAHACALTVRLNAYAARAIRALHVPPAGRAPINLLELGKKDQSQLA